MRPGSLCGILRVFYLHAQTAVDAGDLRTWRTVVILITGKLEDPQFEPHARIKMTQVLRSPLFLYDLCQRLRIIWFYNKIFSF